MPPSVPITPLPRAFGRWVPTVALVVLLLGLLAACGDLREVRKRLEGWQEPSAPTETERPAEAPPEPAPAPPGTAAVPPGPGAALPGLRLTPPPGVVPVTRIAILLPLSGPEAGLGQALLNAAQLALFSLAGDDVALLPVDTQGTPEGAAAAAQAALEDGAELVLGPVFSAEVAGASGPVRAAGVQMVAFSNDRSVAGGGVYVMGFTPETQIGRITAYAAARGVRRVAALLPVSPYGVRVEQVLRAAAAEHGLQLAEIARYRGTDPDALAPIVRRLGDYDTRHARLLARRRELEGKADEASRQALKRLEGLDTLGEVDFDAVLVPEGGGALRALAPLLPFYDVDPRRVRMLGTVQWDDPALATEPALFGGWFPAPPPAARRAFEEAYEKTYGSPPPRLASLAYDATALAAVLARRRAPPPMAAGAAGPAAPPEAGAPAAPPPLPRALFTAEALTAPNGFAGVDGIFRLLPSGLVERGLAVKEVRDRRFVVVSPAPTTFQKLGN